MLKEKIVCTPVDMDKYPRKMAFSYFSKIKYPYTSVTVNVDITSFLAYLKKKGYPFFLSFQYVAMKAVNATPNLLIRLKDGKLYSYKETFPSYTLALPDESFAFCTADTSLPFCEYLSVSQKQAEEIVKNPSLDDEETEVDALVFVSCLPWISYTSHTMETPEPADTNPRLTWGKYFKQGRKMLLPLTLFINHAVADGRDMGKFYQNLESELKNFQA
jgi:chloramphenicol O-acetyltransferase type A